MKSNWGCHSLSFRGCPAARQRDLATLGWLLILFLCLPARGLEPQYIRVGPVVDTDGITRVSGTAFWCRIYLVGANDALTPIGDPVSFRSGAQAGFALFDLSRMGLSLASGATPSLRAGAWEGVYGSLAAAQAGGGRWGLSPIVQVNLPSPSGVEYVDLGGFELMQALAFVPLSLDPSVSTNGPGAVTNSVSVATAGPILNWRAVSLADWVRIISGTNGMGPASVQYAVAPTPEHAPRSARLAVGSVSTLAYDDGVPETSGVQDVVHDGVALRITPTNFPCLLLSVAACFPPDPIQYYQSPLPKLAVKVYGASNGEPAALLGSGVSLTSPPLRADSPVWASTDVSDLGIVITRGEFFVEFEWTAPSSPPLAFDSSVRDERRTWIYESGAWKLMASAYTNTVFANVELMARATLSWQTRPQVLTVTQDRALWMDPPVPQIPGRGPVGLHGPLTGWVQVDTSADLVHWTPILTNQLVQGELSLDTLPSTPGFLQFYRAWLNSAP